MPTRVARGCAPNFLWDVSQSDWLRVMVQAAGAGVLWNTMVCPEWDLRKAQNHRHPGAGRDPDVPEWWSLSWIPACAGMTINAFKQGSLA